MSVLFPDHRGVAGGPVAVSVEHAASSHLRRYCCTATWAATPTGPDGTGSAALPTPASSFVTTLLRCATYLDAFLLSLAGMFLLPALSPDATANTDSMLMAPATSGAALANASASALSAATAGGRPMVAALARPFGLPPLCAAAALAALVVLRLLLASRRVVEQSVTAVRDVGLQLTTRTLGGATHAQLLDVGRIDGILIYEGYFRHRCVYFLCVVMREAPHTVVLFDDTLPRRAALVPVLRGRRHVLYGEREHGLSLPELLAAAE